MKCPRCMDVELRWDCDFDIEDEDFMDKNGERYEIQSCWHCPECDATISLPI